MPFIEIKNARMEEFGGVKRLQSHRVYCTQANLLKKSRETTRNVALGPRIVRSLAVTLGLRRGLTVDSATGRKYSEVS